jgi:hypothetical protein
MMKSIRLWEGMRCKRCSRVEKCMWNQSNHEVRNAPCAEGAQGHQCSSGLLGIPERFAAWKSLTEGVLEFRVGVLHGV